MKKFEYRLVEQSHLRGKTADKILNFLDDVGNDGWELCGIDYGCLIFKREVSNG